MENPMDVRRDDYTFESAPEVLEKMRQAEDLHQHIPEESVQDLQRVDVSHHPYRRLKRLLDVVISAVGLVVLLVPMLLIAVIVMIDNPGPAIFSQYRVGLNGKRFKLYKFRSMRRSTPKYMATEELENPVRYITKSGKLLRKLSLDELPPLWNVLRGDMSLIGPRPHISDEYEIHAMRMRFGVNTTRPGITGLAQINGRDLIRPDEKIHWDVKYLENFGLRTDLRILFSTFPKVFDGRGVSEGSKTAPDAAETAETPEDPAPMDTTGT